MPVRSDSLEAVENDTGRAVSHEVGDGGGDRRRSAGRGRRVWHSQGISLLIGFVLAGLVLLFLSEPVVEGGTAAVSWPEVGPPALPETVPGFDEGALRARIQGITGGLGGVYGVAVLEPGSRTWLSLRGDEQFMTASIGKLPTLVTLYRAAARGEVDLEEKIPILPGNKRSGSGGLVDVPAGYSISLREYAYRLTNHSDNTAWVALDRRLGEERIRAEQMIDAMTGTDVEDRIPGKLPSGVRVAHKTGSWEGNFGDAGIVFYKGPSGVEKHYYIAVLSSGAGEGEARDMIQEISLAVYEALTAPGEAAR